MTTNTDHSENADGKDSTDNTRTENFGAAHGALERLEDEQDDDSDLLMADARPEIVDLTGGFHPIDPFEIVLETIDDDRTTDEWNARVSGAPAYGDHAASTPGDALRQLAEQFDIVVDRPCVATEDNIDRIGDVKEGDVR